MSGGLARAIAPVITAALLAGCARGPAAGAVSYVPRAREQSDDAWPTLDERAWAVREVMRERQRELGRNGNVVIEGRDIGTVVAPQAQVKVYLVADERTRAARRSSERPGIGADALATDLRLRDEKDAVNMRPADDAIQIDTTDLAVDEVVLTGQHTHICIRHTAYGALIRGYRISVPRDAVCAFEGIDEDEALEYLRTVYGAHVTSVGELVGHPVATATAGLAGDYDSGDVLEHEP